MTDFPKDGSTFVVEAIDRTAYRWAKYKPDGARQMGKSGRWQKQVWSGEWFKWENCEEPTGELSLPIEDGPISAAFKSSASKDAEIAKLREECDELKAAINSAEIDNGLTSNGGLWRFWSARAKGVAAKFVIVADENKKLREALINIAQERDCGCSPVCQCNSESSLEIEVDALKDIARAALKGGEA